MLGRGARAASLPCKQPRQRRRARLCCGSRLVTGRSSRRSSGGMETASRVGGGEIAKPASAQRHANGATACTGIPARRTGGPAAGRVLSSELPSRHRDQTRRFRITARSQPAAGSASSCHSPAVRPSGSWSWSTSTRHGGARGGCAALCTLQAQRSADTHLAAKHRIDFGSVCFSSALGVSGRALLLDETTAKSMGVCQKRRVRGVCTPLRDLAPRVAEAGRQTSPRRRPLTGHTVAARMKHGWRPLLRSRARAPPSLQPQRAISSLATSWRAALHAPTTFEKNRAPSPQHLAQPPHSHPAAV